MMFSSFRRAAFVVPGAVALAAAACDTRADAGRVDTAHGDVVPAAEGPAAPSEAARQAAAQGAALHLAVAPEGNTVRYRVREQLVGFDLPNDAVGETAAVTGGIAFDAKGQVVPAASQFTVDAATLKSDRDRRDNFIRSRTLVTAENPSIVLKPTALKGLTMPLPSSGERQLELVGDLTVKGVTRPTTWKVNARFADGRVTGTAATAFAFTDFQLEQPKVRSVLSVADTIRLEYDFALVKK